MSAPQLTDRERMLARNHVRNQQAAIRAIAAAARVDSRNAVAKWRALGRAQAGAA